MKNYLPDIFNLLKASMLIFLGFTLISCSPGNEQPSVAISTITIADSSVSVPPSLVSIDYIESKDLLLVADESNNKLHFVNPDSKQTTHSISLVGRPGLIAISENEQYAFMAYSDLNYIDVIDISSLHTDVARIELPTPATSMAVNSEYILFVGIGSEMISHDIFIFDVVSPSESINTLGSLGVSHGFISGINHQGNTLVTSAFQEKAPSVKIWNVTNLKNLNEINTKSVFGSSVVLNNPGTVIFSPDDTRIFVLTQGSESNDAELPIYDESLNLLQRRAYYTDYNAIALAFNASGDHLVVAHNNEYPVNSTAVERHDLVADLHVFNVNSGEQIMPPIEIPDFIRPNSLIVNRHNTVFALLLSSASSTEAASILMLKL